MKTLIVSLLALCLAASAQDDKRFTPIFGGRRMALVIGNKSYTRNPLVNPVNDAKAIAKMLIGIGFAKSDVRLVIDANQTELRHSVRQFVESVKPGDLAFVYYSGHGVEVKGANYLLPIDLPADATEGYVEDEAVSAQRLLNELTDQGAAVKVLILDACRDNPLRDAKSTAGGLAQMEGNGALILFATQAGQTAADTAGSSNSVFAKYLLKDLTEPGVPLREAAIHVARNVARETNNKQIPQMYGMMLEDVVLVPGSAPPHEARISPPVPIPADQEAWLVVKDSGNASLLEQFIKEFPQSSYAGVARLKLANLAAAPVAPGTGDAFVTAKVRGINVEALTSDVAKRVGVPSGTQGVAVTAVDQAGDAADKVEIGIVITAIDRHPVTTVAEFKRLMNLAGDKAVLLTINNRGLSGYVVVQPK